MLCPATSNRASAVPFLVASGKPLRLNQRTAAVKSLSVSGRGAKVERGTVEPGSGFTSMSSPVNSSCASTPAQSGHSSRMVQATSAHHFTRSCRFVFASVGASPPPPLAAPAPPLGAVCRNLWRRAMSTRSAPFCRASSQTVPHLLPPPALKLLHFAAGSPGLYFTPCALHLSARSRPAADPPKWS